MGVFTLEQPYKTATEKSHIGNWLNQTIALRVDAVGTGKDGSTSSVTATVFTVADTETGEQARIESARIIGQLAGFELGDIVVAHVAPLGKRGQVLAPPAAKDKDAEALAAAFTTEDEG